jgi:hypothetical protein
MLSLLQPSEGDDLDGLGAAHGSLHHEAASQVSNLGLESMMGNTWLLTSACFRIALCTDDSGRVA